MDGKYGIMVCKLKGRMHKEGIMQVEKKGWMEKGALSWANIKVGWIREVVMMLK